MPQLPTSHPSERRPSHKWIWLSILGLILLCGAAVHRRQLPLQRSKDLSGYKFIYLSPAAESLEQVPHLNNDDEDDNDDVDEEEGEPFLIDEDPIEVDSSKLRRRRRAGRRVQAAVQGAQF